MQKIIFIMAFFMLCSSTYSQQRISKSELEIFKKNLGSTKLLKEDDADFINNTVSPKWNNESAVILAQKTSFDFDKKGMSVGKRIGRNVMGLFLSFATLGLSMIAANTTTEVKILVEETERRKILLKDKFAIDQYSVLYFRLSSSGDAFDARVHKKDGSIQKVSFEEAVKVENVKQVPDLFRSYTDDNISSTYRPMYFKVVVPDLEEGDILEYEFVNYNNQAYGTKQNFKEFNPVYYLCNRGLPVNKQILEVVMEDSKYHLSYKSLQGAPDFKLVSGKSQQVYRWEDNDRDKMPNIRYVNKFLEMPSVKFQVIYAKNSITDYMFVNDENDQKKELSEKDFGEKAKLLWTSGFKTSNDNNALHSASYAEYTDAAKTLYKLMKKRGATEGSDDEFIRKAYYTIRSKTLYSTWNDFTFAKVFAGLLEHKNIKYQVVATSSNVLSNISNVSFTNEIVWVIKVNNRYYSNPNEHLNPAEIPLRLNGNRSVSFQPGEKTDPLAGMIPLSDTSANAMHYNFKTSMSSDSRDLNVDENIEASGLVKAGIIDDVLAFTPFMESDYKNYDADEMFEGVDEKSKTKLQEELNAQKKEWKDEKMTFAKALLEDEYSHDVVGDVNFKVVQDGRSFKKQTLIYNQSYAISGMSAKAGDDIVLSIPALVGQQSQIRKEERQRKNAVDVGYPRSISWDVRFDIPSGYKVEGLERLQQSIHNETGTFTSSVRVEGSTLVMTVRKNYNTKYLNLQQWPLLMEVLDAAFNFSQAKIILKKA